MKQVFEHGNVAQALNLVDSHYLEAVASLTIYKYVLKSIFDKNES